MLTYSEAVELVREQILPRWDADGEFHVSSSGFEDDEAFMVPWGAREWLVDGDRSFMLLSGSMTFVDKETYEVADRFAVEMLDRVDKMTAVDVTQIDEDAPIPE